jgi:hypothetical protein
MTGNQFSKVLLQSLGYSGSDFSTSAQRLEALQARAGIIAAASPASGSSPILRSQAVDISFGSLSLIPKDGTKSLIQSLLESGAVDRTAAVGSGLISEPPKDTNEDTDTGGSSSHHHHSSSNTTDTTPPTFTVNASSVHAGGDTIMLNFATAMNTAYSPLVITSADDASGSGCSVISTTNASQVWSNGNKTLTVTLDEQTDKAFIPAEKYIGASISAVAVNGLYTATSAVYTANPVIGETTSPVLTSWDLDLSSGAITMAFSEVVSAGSIMVEGITLANSSTSAIFHLTAASTLFGSGPTPTVKVMLNTDKDNTALTCSSADVSYIVLDADTIRDLTGNGNEALTAPGIKVNSYTN